MQNDWPYEINAFSEIDKEGLKSHLFNETLDETLTDVHQKIRFAPYYKDNSITETFIGIMKTENSSLYFALLKLDTESNKERAVTRININK